jgi:hypothetical protein
MPAARNIHTPWHPGSAPGQCTPHPSGAHPEPPCAARVVAHPRSWLAGCMDSPYLGHMLVALAAALAFIAVTLAALLSDYEGNPLSSRFLATSNAANELVAVLLKAVVVATAVLLDDAPKFQSTLLAACMLSLVYTYLHAVRTTLCPPAAGVHPLHCRAQNIHQSRRHSHPSVNPVTNNLHMTTIDMSTVLMPSSSAGVATPGFCAQLRGCAFTSRCVHQHRSVPCRVPDCDARTLLLRYVPQPCALLDRRCRTTMRMPRIAEWPCMAASCGSVG